MRAAITEVEPVVLDRTRWWEPLAGGMVHCQLCPRECRIKPGHAGFCAIRYNAGGRLAGLGYGRPTGFAVDPIEKKPLYHFLPGSKILSFGTIGCNLSCRFCQNAHLSRAREVERHGPLVEPAEVVRLAQRSGCPSIAFTYNEPTIFAEYAIDVATLAREQGLRCVAVTAGYINPGPRAELYRHLDGANIDLKGCSEEFYHTWSRVHLQPILDTIRWVRDHTACWIELTNLVIPGLNDGEADLRRLVDWVAEQLGPDVPLHFSAFRPAHRLLDRPRTPAATLFMARTLARQAGLRHVYVGNIEDPEGSTTRCVGCGEVLIRRGWFHTEPPRLTAGRCPRCQTPLPGVWVSP